MKLNRFNLTIIVVLVLCLAAALPVLAQRPGPTFGQGALAQSATAPDYLAQLKRALQAAGAAALTPAQETQIDTLITNFRASHTPQTPNTAVQAARAAYDDAILHEQLTAAAAQIPTIVNEMTANASTRLHDRADFAISVVKALNAAQINALVTKFGTTRTVQLLESLAGGPGFGPGPRQGAMRMGRP
jgi:cell division septation protein DedD